MTKQSRTLSYVRVVSLLTGLMLPALALMPFGTLWLWQNGYILHWAIAAASLVAIAFLIQWRLLRNMTALPHSEAGGDITSKVDEGDPGWTPAEEKAWQDVVAIARGVDVARLESREAVIELGTKTIRAVAKRLHPEVAEPLWQFTVPEAFALIERVSRRLGAFTVENIPLSDRFTVAQAKALYEWRGAIGMAEKAYDVWRLVRLANPLTAVTHELRERLSKQMLEWGRDHVAQRLAHAYVTEVGRAAIDLYGGRLRVPAVLASRPSNETTDDDAAVSGRTLDPLRLLIAGQVGAGKSSLVNALAAEVHAAVDALPATTEFTTYRLQQPDFPEAQLIDSPGIEQSERALRTLIEKAQTCDLILWVVPAHRADREIDRKALVTIREAFVANPNRRQPPTLLVLSHIDKLRPLLEWAPPYDLQSTTPEKALSIRAVVDTAGEELGFDANDIVPVSLMAGANYNIDALWARVFMALPDAQRAQLVRRIHDARSDWNWQRIWSQAVGAGRVVGRTLAGRPPR